MFISEFERRGGFLVGSRLGTRNWEDENFGAGLASGGEIDILVVFGELQEYVSSHRGQRKPVRTEIEDGDLSQ